MSCLRWSSVLVLPLALLVVLPACSKKSAARKGAGPSKPTAPSGAGTAAPGTLPAAAPASGGDALGGSLRLVDGEHELDRQLEIGRGFLVMENEDEGEVELLVQLFNADDQQATCKTEEARGDGWMVLATSDYVKKFTPKVGHQLTFMNAAVQSPRDTIALGGEEGQTGGTLSATVTSVRGDIVGLELALVAPGGRASLRGTVNVLMCGDRDLPVPAAARPAPGPEQRDLDQLCGLRFDNQRDLSKATLESPAIRALASKLTGREDFDAADKELEAAILARARPGAIERAGMPQCAQLLVFWQGY